MKEIKAHLRYLRMAPRKVRLVTQSIRGKRAKNAEIQLCFTQKAAALPVLKLLRSAMANAKHNFQIDVDRLMVRSIRVDGGPTLKRFMPRARGMASSIRKRTSHITLVLSDTKDQKLKI